MLIALGIAAAIVVIVIFIYNRLVTLRENVKNAWSVINTQLQRRYDLIPNLVETVKGYMTHERETLEAIAKARSLFMTASTVKQTAEAENMLAGALKSLFAVSENYPELKASQNFMMLQEELAGTENKISYSRQNYNNAVMDYNVAVKKFPTNILASLFNFREHDFFDVDNEEARKAVKVTF